MHKLAMAIIVIASFGSSAAVAQSARESCRHHCLLNYNACNRYASNDAQRRDCSRGYIECSRSCR